VGPRTGLDVVTKEIYIVIPAENRSPVVEPVLAAQTMQYEITRMCGHSHEIP